MAIPFSAGNTSATLAQYPTVYYDRKAVVFLRSNLHLYDCIEQKPMPDKSGVKMQIFGYTKLPTNATNTTTVSLTSTASTASWSSTFEGFVPVPAIEGIPGGVTSSTVTSYNGIVLTASTGAINLSQFVDYVTYSDKAVLTNISPIVTEGAELLAYRGALGVDEIISNEADVVAAADSTTNILNAVGNPDTFMTAATNRRLAFGLRAIDGKPQANGLFKGVISSLLAFDLVNDSNAGGFQDAFRYIDPKALQNSIDANTQRVAVIGNVEWFESNALPVVPSYDDGSTHGSFQTTTNGYRAYVFAKDAFFGASLGKTQLGQRNFSVMTREFAEGQNSLDPAAQIRAASVYNFYFGVTPRPNGPNVFRRLTSASSIG